jgi:hypothetical protein
MKKMMMVLGLCAGLNFCAVQVNAQKGNTSAKTNDNSDKNDLNFQKHWHTNLKEMPSNVSKNYEADFPNSLNINWSSEPGVWYVRCDDMNGYKCLTMYKSNGTKGFTARNLKAGEVPPAVATYCAANGETFTGGTIIQVEVPGQANFWRITNATGRKIFVDMSGSETTCDVDGFATY